MSWFNKSADSDEAIQTAERNAKRKRKKPAKRFWMPPGERKKVLVLDDSPPGVDEHNPMIDGTYKDNQFTCRRLVNDPSDPGCHMCNEKIYYYWIGFYTILDLSEVEYEGKVYKNFRRLLPAKTKMLKYLKDKRAFVNEKSAMEGKPQTGLMGKVFSVSRSDKKASSIGDSWDLLGEEPMVRDSETGLWVVSNQEYWWKRTRTDEKSGKEIVEMRPPLPYNYEEVLAPLSNAEMRAALNRGSGAPDSGESGPYNPGDPIPF